MTVFPYTIVNGINVIVICLELVEVRTLEYSSAYYMSGSSIGFVEVSEVLCGLEIPVLNVLKVSRGLYSLNLDVLKLT